MLKRIASSHIAHVAQLVAEVLDSSEARGTISAVQKQALARELAARLDPLL